MNVIHEQIITLFHRYVNMSDPTGEYCGVSGMGFLRVTFAATLYSGHVTSREIAISRPLNTMR